MCRGCRSSSRRNESSSAEPMIRRGRVAQRKMERREQAFWLTRNARARQRSVHLSTLFLREAPR
jgi:hypothetical protein